MSKNKLDDSWFDPNTLVWLEGSWTTVKKDDVKNLLDGLGIKWTIKFNDNITKVLTVKHRYLTQCTYTWYSNPYPNQSFVNSLPKSSVMRPEDLVQMIRNETCSDMSEFTSQVLDLLKSNDENNVELAVIMIGEALLEPQWIPWLLFRKDKESVKELLKKNNIKLGQWYIHMVQYEFHRGIDRLKNDLLVSDEYLLDFIKDFINSKRF